MNYVDQRRFLLDTAEAFIAQAKRLLADEDAMPAPASALSEGALVYHKTWVRPNVSLINIGGLQLPGYIATVGIPPRWLYHMGRVPERVELTGSFSTMDEAVHALFAEVLQQAERYQSVSH